MRYPASEKAEIIRLVEQSTCRPSARWTNSASREPRFIAGMTAIARVASRRWLTIGPDQTGSGIASPTTSATRSLIWRWLCQSYRRESWPCGSPTSGSCVVTKQVPIQNDPTPPPSMITTANATTDGTMPTMKMSK